MEIRLAENIGFCFGVKRAVDMALEEQAKSGKTIYTLGEIIHNASVVSYLKEKSIVVVNDLSELDSGDTVVIRSHGAPVSIIEQAKERCINVIDATCPYVKKIHNIVSKAYQDGKRIIIAGSKEHPEVIGINGHCGFEAIIISDMTQIPQLDKDERICLVAQTTFMRSAYNEIAEYLKKSFKNVEIHDTICDTTKNRQEEAEALSKLCDCVIVIGGKNSSNTQKLYKICKKNCKKTVCIENSCELTLDIVKNNGIIGIVAGASTPDWMIREVITRMNELEKAVANANEAQETAAEPTAENTEKESDGVVEATATAEKGETATASSANKGGKKKPDDSGEQSFAEALESAMVRIKDGQVLKERVLAVTEDEVWVSITGYKSDGYIPRSEFSMDPSVNLTEAVKPGDEIKVVVLKVNDGSGKGVLLSRLPIEKKEKIEAMFNDETLVGKVIEARVKEVVKGGLVAFANGVRIFVPAKLVGLRYVKDLDSYIKKKIKVKVIEIDKPKRSLIGSARAILEEELEEQQREFCSNLTVGSKVKGVVKRFTKFGYFVDIGGFEGKISIRDLSWSHVENPGEMFEEGQEIEVVILSIDTEKCHVALGYKQLQPKPDPWAEIAEKYPVGSVVEGKVVRILPFGAFVQITPSIDALIHISHVGARRIAKIEDEIHLGDTVRCKVLEIDVNAKRMNISRKDLLLEENPALAAEIEREQAERERERAERAARRAAYELKRKEREAKAEGQGESTEAPASERPRSHKDDADYELPPVEQSTTSLASLFANLKDVGEGE
ncbi:MAG TPA: bifunctional 4-hydroxy-3-methylbut-2-enyl diphosphate reductase/30S ribosomal protein S1 [Clostridiales bacterium]|jgi:small subunit ribosomal protein S1|nr:bifunctional 4-hydroxy-3-methylbut-2-enyl diphosphate reductase/30S ribosomal protein S1 [Clostridiales bacterium]